MQPLLHCHSQWGSTLNLSPTAWNRDQLEPRPLPCPQGSVSAQQRSEKEKERYTVQSEKWPAVQPFLPAVSQEYPTVCRSEHTVKLTGRVPVGLMDRLLHFHQEKNRCSWSRKHLLPLGFACVVNNYLPHINFTFPMTWLNLSCPSQAISYSPLPSYPTLSDTDRHSSS